MINRFMLLAISFLLFSLYLNAKQLNLIPDKKLERVKGEVLFLKNDHSICFLDNGLLVYLLKPPFENQTWTEWCFGSEHVQPDSIFYFPIEKWNSSSLFQLYHYKWESDSSIHSLQNLFYDDPNLELKYPYFIENMDTGEMTLCQILTLKDLELFLINYGEECYEAGRSSGYSTGFGIGYLFGKDKNN